MGQLPDRIESAVHRARGHTLVRAAVVYASASFLVLQVLDLFGLSTQSIRGVGAALAAAFVAGAGVYAGRARRSRTPRRVSPRGRPMGALLGGRRWAIAAGILLLLGAGAWRLGARLVRSPVRPGTDVIAVLPFVTSGGDLDELGVGMVSLLTANLDQVGGIRTIDVGTVLHGWRRRAGDGSLELTGALQVGRDVEAGAILWGQATAVRDAMQVRAQLYTVDGELIADEEVRGDIDDLHTLVDRLSVAVLREIWRGDAPVPDLRIGAITTESPRALHEYVQGQRHLRAGRYDSAIVTLRSAAELDSTFALAHFHLAEAYGWAEGHGSASGLRAAEAASRFTERLPARERSLLTAHLLHERGDLAALDSLDAITRRYPDDPVAWYMLGDVRYHARVLLAPDADQLTGPFRRAVALDPTLSSGMVHLLDEAIFTGDRALYDEFLTYYRAAVPVPIVERWERVARIRWAPPDSIGTYVEQAMANVTPSDLRWIGPRLQNILTWRFAKEMALDPDVLVAGFRDIPPEAPEYLPVMRLRPMLLASLGRAFEGSRWLDSLARVDPAAEPPPFFARILWGVHGLLPHDSVAPALATLARDTGWYVGDVLRLYHLGRGDIRAAEALRLSPLPPDTGQAATTPRGIREAMDAMLLLARGDTAAGLAQMEQAIRHAGYLPDGIRPLSSGPLQAYAVALARRPDRREEGLRRLRGMLALGDVYTVPAYFAIAEALEAEGDRAGAAEAYAHIVRLWSNADPHLQPRVEHARRALARLTGEPASGR